MKPSRSASLVAALAVTVPLALGAAVRLLDLESNPPGLWQDEASTGLDAYLLWHTGRDQRGEWLPIIAASFGDYPLAGYRYLAAPIVGIFGLTPGNERLIAAVFGTLLLLAAFVAMRMRTTPLAAWGTLIAGALCPTWIHFSRYGSEAILLPFALTAGWVLIELERPGVRRACVWLGAAVLASAAYTYHAVKLVLPLWMIAFLLFQTPRVRTLWQQARLHLVGPAILFSVLVAPSVIVAFTPAGMARGNTVLATTHFEGWDIVRVMVDHYLSYFDPRMLFLRGGPHVVQSVPGLGLWNLVDLPFMVVGFVAMARGQVDRRFGAFLLFWFLLGPLPGGISSEAQNVGRVIGWLPAPQMLSGLGFGVVATRIGRAFRSGSAARKVAGGLVAVGLATAYGWTTRRVYHRTLVYYPRIAKREWQFEISEALRCAQEQRTNETVLVSPSFQVASVFARYHFVELEKRETRMWRLAETPEVRPGQLYAFPKSRPLPQKGKEICRIMDPRSGEAVAYVYGPAD